MLKQILLWCALLCGTVGQAQPRFSLTAGGSLLRNFSPQQKFWSFGQVADVNVHLSPRQTVYGSIAYYLPGRFTNVFTAPQIALGTIPSTMNYSVLGKWKFNQFSLGWKHYFFGSYTNEESPNIYGMAGLGVLFAKAENNISSALDTTVYALPDRPLIGAGSFKRLTLDLGAGGEWPIGGSIFIFADLRTWLPASSYPSPYFHNRKNVPLPLALNAGLRILFGTGE